MKRILSLCLLAIVTLAASAQSQRECILFDEDWQFAFGDASSFNGLAQVILSK